MAGDYTRFSFDPIKGFSGVLKQQGRVSLDSEDIEFEEILDRRVRAEMYDIVGPGVVPMTTPTGFQIGVNPAGKLTIGIGRAYVDGIIAECFGELSNPAATVRDDRLGGVDGSGPVVYDQQPFFYQPAYPALSPTPGVINLVYLDVWQREVTVYEDYALREVALNGPDTATRMQTAWQVKVLEPADAGSCTAPPPAWATLTAPSTARLTAQAAPAAPAPGPCVINPAGGYTGLENRLYRVEIHRAGTLTGAGGTTRAQFKWSRDNASLAARVLSVAPLSPTDAIITVSSTGRDSWMRFDHDDHIELSDDFVEYAMRETGIGGPMARVVTVNHATGEIHVTNPAGFASIAVVAARHPRIRRWDYASPGDPLVTDTDNGVALPLEEGISITFGNNNGDTLHAGDFWVFAARTTDGSIDNVVNAPPRGILHHFMRLALVTSGAPPTLLSDCRIFWPPPFGTTVTPGCCTVVVKPGESIQAAIDSLPAAGGCVCLKAGSHPIAAPLVIAREGVILHGESPGVHITAAGLPVMLQVSGGGAVAHDVEIAMISFELAGAVTDSTILLLQDCARVRVAECAMRYVTPGIALVIGVTVITGEAIDLASNLFERCAVGVYGDGYVRGLAVRENRLLGMLYESDKLVIPVAPWGVRIPPRATVHCHDNQFEDFLTAVLVQPGVTEAAIVDNEIRRSALPPAVDTPQPIENLVFAIDVQGDRCRVAGNRIDLRAQVYGGVRVKGRHNDVTGNRLPATIEKPVGGPVGIWAGAATPADLGDGDFTNLAENHFTGAQFAVVASQTRAMRVAGNTIIGQERQAGGVWAFGAIETLVAGNVLGDIALPLMFANGDRNRVVDNEVSASLSAALLNAETAFDFSGNLIEDASVFGVGVANIGQSNRFVRNRIAHCAYAATGVAVGIGVLELGANVDLAIESCEIIDTGLSPDHKTVAAARAIGIAAGAIATCELADNRIAYEGENPLDPALEHRAVWLVGVLAFSAAVGAGVISYAQGGAIITGNVFEGPGLTHLVELQQIVLAATPTSTTDLRFEKVTFANNRCLHSTRANDGFSTVTLFGSHMIVNGNHVKAPPGVPSFDLNHVEKIAVIANCTTGIYLKVVPTVLPAPIGSFNVTV
jgi:hypothetical protein